MAFRKFVWPWRPAFCRAHAGRHCPNSTDGGFEPEEVWWLAQDHTNSSEGELTASPFDFYIGSSSYIAPHCWCAEHFLS